jgi:opacity protein-like surface antigen
MLRRYAFAFAVGVLGSIVTFVSAAQADKAPRRAKRAIVAVPVQTWTGWYGGGSIGYADGQVTRGTPSFPASASLAPSGFVGALYGGYDYQLANNFVLGARLTVPILSLSSSAPSGGVTFVGKVKSAVILTGRIGYPIGKIMPYALGGGVWGRGEATVVGFGSATADHTGYIVGFGAEYRLTPNWSIDANYSFLSMDKQTYNFVPVGGSAVQQGFDSHNFMIGAHYRP